MCSSRVISFPSSAVCFHITLAGVLKDTFHLNTPAGGQGCSKGWDLPAEQTWAAPVLEAGTCSDCQSSKGTPAKINVHADG